MAKITNAGKGPKGIYVKSEGTITEIEIGQTIEISDEDVAAIIETKAVAGMVAAGDLVVDGYKAPEKKGDKKEKAA